MVEIIDLVIPGEVMGGIIIGVLITLVAGFVIWFVYDIGCTRGKRGG